MKFKKIVFQDLAIYVELAEYNRVMFYYPAIYTGDIDAFIEMATFVIDTKENVVIKATAPLVDIFEASTSDDLLPRNYIDAKIKSE